MDEFRRVRRYDALKNLDCDRKDLPKGDDILFRVKAQRGGCWHSEQDCWYNVADCRRDGDCSDTADIRKGERKVDIRRCGSGAQKNDTVNRDDDRKRKVLYCKAP